MSATPPSPADASALLAPANRSETPHPAYLALLANLASANSQRTYHSHLQKAAQLLCERDPVLRARHLSIDEQGHARLADPSLAARLPWHQLRMETVLWLKSEASVREGADAHIANPASVNGLIHALRGIDREAFKLELMTGDNCERIRLVPLIRYRRLKRAAPCARRNSPIWSGRFSPTGPQVACATLPC